MQRPRITRDSTVVATSDQMSRAVGDETVILGLGAGTYYGLDNVGSRIWALVQEPRKVDAICETIAGEYAVERDRCERDTVELLGRLAEENLIEVRE